VALLALSSTVASWGSTLQVGAISLDVDGGWTLKAPSESRGRGIEPGTGRILGEWVRDDGSANLNVAVLPSRVEIHPAHLQSYRRTILQAACSARPDGSEFRLEEIGMAEVSGLPAYRLRCTTSFGGVEVKQVQLLVSARETYVVTFSTGGPAGADKVVDLDGLARTIHVDARSRGLRDMPEWFCGGLLGALAGMAVASRVLRRRTRAATQAAPGGC
jgi:hypothetical protein